MYVLNQIIDLLRNTFLMVILWNKTAYFCFPLDSEKYLPKKGEDVAIVGRVNAHVCHGSLSSMEIIKSRLLAK